MNIFDYLPYIYSTDANNKLIVTALTIAYTNKINEILSIIEVYQTKYLEPLTCEEEWLDKIAYWGGWGDIWDGSWEVSAKRKLLSNTQKIWEERGSIVGLERVLEAFDINALISSSQGFLVGVSQLPSLLSSSPFDIVITLQNIYSEADTGFKILKHLVKYFLPCWVEVSYVFDS